MLLYLRHGVELFISMQRGLWAAYLLAELLVLFRLSREQLLARYPLFAAFLAADLTCSIVLLQTNLASRSYAAAFRICTLIMFIFRLGVAGELYERICDHFPGIGWFRAFMASGLGLIASAVAVSTFQPNLVRQWAFPQTAVVLIQRYQSEIFTATFILTWLFLRFVLNIRQPFRPNVLVHWGLTTIYFGVSSAANLAALFIGGGKALAPVSDAMLAAQGGCFLAWFCLLRRSGKELPPFPRLSPDQVVAVENYNQDLLRTVRSLPGEIASRQEENPNIPLRRAPLH